jgi:Uri superfamily endonuclease
MRVTGHRLGARPGTYALLLGLQEPAELEVGRLGAIRFDSPFYLYFGSAFGPGGLKARLGRHLRPERRLHWHIDYLRQVTEILGVWHTNDTARLECTWARAASALRGASLVPRFGSSDCHCRSHLLAFPRLPGLRAFRRRLDALQPGCAGIRHLQLSRARSGRQDAAAAAQPGSSSDARYGSGKAFFDAAVAAEGRDNGAPGLRSHYHPHHDGAFVLDSDGHKIEAVCHHPE